VVNHALILRQLLDQIQPINFREEVAALSESEKLSKKHFVITCIDKALQIATKNNWGLCRNNDSVYLYNGAFWNSIPTQDLAAFLGKAALKMGMDNFVARHFSFQEDLLKQFQVDAHLPKPERNKGVITVNLLNGTYEIAGAKQGLRPTRKEDFITYQLPFNFDPLAKAPQFQSFLDKSLPNVECQMVLAEFIGYLFIRTGTLKLEKVLLLYGAGANGKSVLFEVVSAMLGPENVSNYSLSHLTNDNGYFRAMIGDKLLNYATEINGKMQTDLFKQLASGEPVDARMPYGNPFTVTDYAKFIFNCNELPKDIEHVPAYFRRFLIIPFSVTIPDRDQDRALANKIINNELPGVFNWVLQGLSRLLDQKAFTHSDLINGQLEQFKKQSDSVQLFLEDEAYVPSITETVSLKELYGKYRNYCVECGNRYCAMRSFSDRLRANGFTIIRKSYGMVVFIEKRSVS